jgi:hypothetical protein
MKIRSLLSLSLIAASAAVGLRAQSASLSTDTPVLAPSGGKVVLRAVADYDGEPGALGWSIKLPADWSLVAINGPHVPEIKPEAGTGGELEFAFTNVPAARAEFSVIVSYPANSGSVEATSTALVRAGGKLATLTPAPLQMRGIDTGGERRSRN